ncbi:hypothetical protein YQE_08647, partial [Dendroctonus ponderosae]
MHVRQNVSMLIHTLRLTKRFRETGSVNAVRGPLPRKRARTEENVISVLAYAQVNPQLSITQISLHLGVTKNTIHRILADNKFHPYHLFLHQALFEMDYDAR